MGSVHCEEVLVVLIADNTKCIKFGTPYGCCLIPLPHNHEFYYCSIKRLSVYGM
jgi:hypothetical protein